MDVMQLLRMLWRRKVVVVPMSMLGAVALGATYKYRFSPSGRR